jgi:hypothetical protein
VASYVRKQSAASLLESVGKISSAMADQIMRLKPKFTPRAGVSLQLG